MHCIYMCIHIHILRLREMEKRQAGERENSSLNCTPEKITRAILSHDFNIIYTICVYIEYNTHIYMHVDLYIPVYLPYVGNTIQQ